MEEEARLNDPGLCENFIARVYAYHEWRCNLIPNASPQQLVQFHSRYKYFVMAHGQALYRQLGRLVASAGVGDFAAVLREYEQAFLMELLSPHPAQPRQCALPHTGIPKKQVAANLKQDLLKAVEDYRLSLVPLIVPITLLKHYLTHYACDYINQQVYLAPTLNSLNYAISCKPLKINKIWVDAPAADP